MWNHPVIDRPETKGGQFGSLVELFGWPYADVGKECEMIGKAGYMGVKVYPPSESILSDIWLQNGEINPWFVPFSLVPALCMCVSCRTCFPLFP